eukprot:TRINITY_DN4765_c0_g1_i2.p1 TRINITY_DN4765_c0_g1~~TRINITY_DN4765_c0_g1_i2.p1  ORF type:complete len:518 (-),score=70.48 TRINITY_DN4765_c0_g1_i2:164-1717(-)
MSNPPPSSLPEETSLPERFTTMEEVISFIEVEVSVPTPRLAFISIVLGELEENRGKFPLTTFYPTYAKYLEFLEVEMKPCVGEDKAASVKKMAHAAWHGKKLWKRRRKYEQKHAHLWHLVNHTKLNCLGFATVVVDACLRLGIDNVFPITSEVHVWLGFMDNDIEFTHPIRVDDLSGMAEIMTPDSEVGCPVRENMTHSWGYQRDNSSVWHATVWGYTDYTGVMIQNSNVPENIKIELMERTLETCKISKNPGGLVELARCFQETEDAKKAEEVFLRGVRASQDHCENSNVFPYTELGAFYVDQGSFVKAIHCFLHGVSVASQYKYTSWDSDLREDFDEISKLVAGSVSTKDFLSHDSERVVFALLIRFFDTLFAWFEKSKVLPPFVWQDSMKKCFSLFKNEILCQPINLLSTPNSELAPEIDATSIVFGKKRKAEGSGTEGPPRKKIKNAEEGIKEIDCASSTEETEPKTFEFRGTLLREILLALHSKPNITIPQRRKLLQDHIDSFRASQPLQRK